jgi:hypothetical protein
MTAGHRIAYAVSIDQAKHTAIRTTQKVYWGDTTIMNSLLTITRPLFPAEIENEATAAPRYEVQPGHILTLHPENQLMRVRSGSAWVSWKAMNVPLEKGGRWIFTQDEFPAVILAQGYQPLVFELHAISTD